MKTWNSNPSAGSEQQLAPASVNAVCGASGRRDRGRGVGSRPMVLG